MSKIKTIFCYGRVEATDEIEIDLDNGKTIKIKPGDTVSKVIARLRELNKYRVEKRELLKVK